MPEDRLPHPPQPPDIRRRWQFSSTQTLGIPLLALLPVLALLEVFGESRAAASASTSRLDLEASYSERYRYGQTSTLDVAVTNRSSARIPSLTVLIDRDYVSRFSSISFSPSPTHIGSEAYIVEITDLEPGDARRIAVQLQADQYGRHQGSVAARAPGAERLRVPVSTLVLP